MSAPNQYPQLPPGVAPLVAGIASEFAAIRHDVEEAARHFPPVITFPPPQVIPASSPPETQTAASIATGWVNYGAGFQTFGYETIGTRAFLRGLVSNLTAITNGGPYVLAILPVQPAERELFTVTGGDPIAAHRVDVAADGSIFVYGNLPANGYVSLSGISFSTLP